MERSHHYAGPGEPDAIRKDEPRRGHGEPGRAAVDESWVRADVVRRSNGRSKLMSTIGRREFLAGALCASAALAARPKGLLIESHVHLYSDDTARFPFANAGGGGRRPSYAVETFLAFAKEARIDRAVIVTPEPYQDDHRYLEYCLERAPSKDFFRSSCLFDPIDPRTPQRLSELVKKNKSATVALRIHEMH